MIVYPHTYTGEATAQTLGGKGANLLLLQREGYNVPPFVVLPISFFEARADAVAIVAQVQEAIQHILDALQHPTQVAVRSSAAAEDSAAYSFAGQFKTILNVLQVDIPQAVADVWQSAQSEALAAYKAHAGIGDIPMAVIIQAMIPADAAGVAFGRNPLTGAADEQVVNAVSGLGDKLVDGTANADTYTVKQGKVAAQPAAATPVLQEAQVQEVAALLQRLETLYAHPQDIEFAFYNSKLYLLQSRPITTMAAIAAQPAIVWDNSNIIESYPGLTLPLTFSFIEKMYEAVYRQFSAVLGVRAKRINEKAQVYANMLGLLNGRVYYNLHSWYAALAQLPGYSVNADFMEQMMGVKDKPDIVLPGANKKPGLGDYWQIVRAMVYILYNLITARRQKEQFVRDFNEIYNRFRHNTYEGATAAAIGQDYSSFEQLMVRKWKAPLVNDFFAMIYFGLLQKLCRKHVPQDANLHNKLIASSQDIITTEPIKRLPRLAAMIAGNETLKNSLLQQDAATAWQTLQQPAYENEHRAIQQYIADWGERSVAELKLETITYVQQPELLIAILQSYLQKQLFTYKENANLAAERAQAGQAMRQALKGQPLQKLLFGHVLRQARYFVSNRENLRYYRTRGFGMVRSLMLAMGEKLQAAGVLADARDIFYLHLAELSAATHGTIPATELAATVANRKKNYTLFQSLPLPERVVTQGKPTAPIVMQLPDAAHMATDTLQGIGCSAGIIQAKVKLVHHAAEFQTLDGQIMATYATDPGWVVLFPSASGILTERGSLLSHAAIVSREMGIPCIVGIGSLMQQLHDGDELIMDGSTGVVKIIQRTAHD